MRSWTSGSRCVVSLPAAYHTTMPVPASQAGAVLCWMQVLLVPKFGVLPGSLWAAYGEHGGDHPNFTRLGRKVEQAEGEPVRRDAQADQRGHPGGEAEEQLA